jgi:ATP-binding cassette subfamily C (CFTR/MRP) protein 2
MVLLDDPISALDANVKKKIFENVLLNHLKSKTIILVTHAIDFLHLVDRIIVFKDGEMVLSGSYSEIENEPYLR